MKSYIYPGQRGTFRIPPSSTDCTGTVRGVSFLNADTVLVHVELDPVNGTDGGVWKTVELPFACLIPHDLLKGVDDAKRILDRETAYSSKVKEIESRFGDVFLESQLVSQGNPWSRNST